MATKYWMISNRNITGDRLGPDLAKMSLWISEGGQLDTLKSWIKVDARRFKRELLEAVKAFPLILEPEQHEKKYPLSLFY